MKAFLKQKAFLITVCILLGMSVIALTAACLSLRQNMVMPSRSVSILWDDCGFSDFEVIDGKVFLYCSVSLTNHSDDVQYVELLADDEEDVFTGLLTQSSLLAYSKVNENYEPLIITLKPHQVLYDISAVFIGDYAGKEQKMDRLIPAFNVIHVSGAPA